MCCVVNLAQKETRVEFQGLLKIILFYNSNVHLSLVKGFITYGPELG